MGYRREKDWYLYLRTIFATKKINYAFKHLLKDD